MSVENLAGAVRAEVAKAIAGQTGVVDQLLVAILADGHVLLEGVPGVAKTLMVRTLSKALALDYGRIQFTPDLMPSDVIGTRVFDPKTADFILRTGPIFVNVLLADEINRATPKSQSALLEAMSEGTITVEKRRLPLPDPFLVIATQNPIEHVGTSPLPESQLDRFLMKLTIGYPSAGDEKQLLRTGGGQEALDHLEPVLDGDEVRELQARVSDVHVSEALVEYLMLIVQTTRTHPEVALGVSTRGALTYFKACQALAMVGGRDFVIPEDVKRLAAPVLSHRIVMKDRRLSRGDFSPEARFIQRMVNEIAVPR